MISFLFIIPASFAEDNQTDIALTGGDADILANDYYFDANIDNDTGDETKLNHYKELTLSRIEDNSIIHLANGGYSLKWNGYANNVTIIGESRESTVINAQGTTLSASSLTLCNLTLIRAPISASGNLTAINSIFKDSAKSVITSSGNNCYINLINCTFNNNNYLSGTGSAINMKGGYLKITDSVFSNNYAHYSGGAIYADGVNATVSNSKFINDTSLNDAGGAIFIINSPQFACINVEFNNCMALFGGAVTSLSSNLNLTRSTAKNNNASYYGGAVFAMYDTFTVDSSVFINNSTHDAGALYVDAVDSAFEFVDACGNYTRDGQNVIWTIDMLASEETMDIETTANDEFVYSGNQTSFTINITNTGEAELTDIFINNNIPEGLIYDSFIGANWTYDGKLFHYTGSLDVGESIALTIVVNTTKSGSYVVNATAGSAQTGNVSDDDSVIVYTPQLTVREIANDPLVVVGTPVSFTVVVTNIGDCDLGNVYTVNNFPDGLIYTGYDGDSWSKLTYGLLGAISDGWTQDGNKFSYSGILKPGESANYTLYFDTTRAGIFTPEVLASSNLTSNAYSNNTTVVIKPSIDVNKVAYKTSVEIGELITYTITVRNNGSCDAEDVFVIEQTPDGLQLVAYSSAVDWNRSGDKFTYNGILASNETAILEIMFKAIKVGKITNTVIATANMADNVTDSCDVEVIKTPVNPDMIVIKTADKTSVKIGEFILNVQEYLAFLR